MRLTSRCVATVCQSRSFCVTKHSLHNKIISLYEKGHKATAIDEYFKKPDAFTASYLMRQQGDLNFSLDVYHVAKEKGQMSISLITSLVYEYHRAGQFESSSRLCHDLLEVYHKTREHKKKLSDYEWNIMIKTLTSHKYDKEALQVFVHMTEEKLQPQPNTVFNILNALLRLQDLNSIKNLVPFIDPNKVKLNRYLFMNIFKLCSQKGDLGCGKLYHDILLRSEVANDTFIGTALLTMYSKSGRLAEARQVFNNIDSTKRDTVMWNSMLSAYKQHGKGREALDLFEQMKKDGVKPDTTSYVIILTVCADIAAFDTGKRIAGEINRSKMDTVLKTSLLNMYSKCGDLDYAIAIFNEMKSSEKDVTVWNSMLSAYKQHGKGREALDLFEQMKKDGVKPDTTSYVIILTVCADIAAFDTGKRIAGEIDHSKMDTVLKTSLLNMYSKCGDLDNAIAIFKEMKSSEKDVAAWNSMLSAYGQHGKGRKALDLFEQMKSEEVKPNSITFVSLLNGCSHSGLVDEALALFDSMEIDYNVKPDDSHFVCIVDTLARIGRLDDAEDLINQMETPSLIALRALLGACRSLRDVVRAERVFQKVMEIDCSDSSTYVMLANIYASTGRQEDSNKIRALMNERGVKKIPGLTKVEIDGKSHSFVSEDASHPETPEIYEMLKQMHLGMVQKGYLADISWVTRDVDDEEKKRLLCLHSEKIAIAYALLRTPEGAPITIAKNLRVCGDCHNATKHIAMYSNREIIVRDASRFHHFTPDGKCSCGDFW